MNVMVADRTHSNFQALWSDLQSDLQDVFDSHFVCSTFSRRIAEHIGLPTILILTDKEANVHNVWMSNPDGETIQERWSPDAINLDTFYAPQSPQYLDKLEQPAAEVMSNNLWLKAQHHILAVPVIRPDRPYSVGPPLLIALIDPVKPDVLSDSDMTTLVRLATVYLERAALRETVDRQTVEFTIISDISHALSSTLNIHQIYRLLTGPIRQMLNVETLSVGLIEPVTGDIIFADQLLGPEFEKIPPVRLKRGQGIAGWVAINQEPVVINDTYSDTRFFAGVDRQSGFRTRSMICIPLKVEEQGIGILQAINRRSGKFNDHDLQIMQALGGPLAAAIENARLHADVLSEKRRIETIFSSMAEGLVTVTSEGIITRVNSAFESLILSNKRNLIGHSIREAVQVRTGDIDAYVQQVHHTSGGNVQWVADIDVGDERWVPVLISGARVEDESGSAGEAILAFSDLTQIREVERMRDDLFQGIVHELRTPLATILMYARLLRDGKSKTADKIDRFLGVIERESDRLQRMVRQMLDLAKLEAREMQHSPKPVDLNPIFEEVLPPFADQALQKGLLFQQRIEENLPPVLGSEDAYIMILKNLIDNAIKFSPSGSIQVIAWQEEENVLIEVSDQGIGIPAEALSNLFKRFYRTETAVERGIAGTGLGLYMVKENLQNYNGTITVTSKLGEGTTFLIRLLAVEN